MPSPSRSLSLLRLLILVLRLKLVTGVPLVSSVAPGRPTPCGYFLCMSVQFPNRRAVARRRSFDIAVLTSRLTTASPIDDYSSYRSAAVTTVNASAPPRPNEPLVRHFPR